MTGSETFLHDLRAEVESHRAVCHPVLAELRDRADRAAMLRFGLQHHRLVGRFTRYLEWLLLRAEDSTDKLWIAKVLVDEYGEGSDGHDHTAMHRAFLRAAGADESRIAATEIHPDVAAFVADHERICREEDWLVGLGAVGPGHEWAIPQMFPAIVEGLDRLGFARADIAYFPLHLQQDVDHGLWLEEALRRHAGSLAAREALRRGALLSLEARVRFWDAVGDCLSGTGVA